MPVVEEAIEVKMNVAEIFPIISDFERYPEFMENCKKVTVLERGEGYTISEWINEVDGRTLKWTERDDIKPEENKIEFEMLKGDLKWYGGFWRLEPDGAKTNVVLNVGFEIGIPMLSALLNPLFTKKLRDNMIQMLSDLKKKAEQ